MNETGLDVAHPLRRGEDARDFVLALRLHLPGLMEANRIKRTIFVAALLLGLSGSTVLAQDREDELVLVERSPADRLLIEVTGGYGFQLGETDYLPDGAATRYQHPLVNGYTVGGTAGVFLAPHIALIGNYEYASASSREGDVPGFIDRVEGEIDYHTATAGVRLYAPVGFGSIRTELALGILFPYEKRTEIEYGSGLQPVGISGTGTRVESFDFGYGGHALIGYEVPVGGPLYLAANLKLKLFQSTNDGEVTELRNFVTDFEALPPEAVTTDIRHEDGASRPSTDSVQEARLQLALGARF